MLFNSIEYAIFLPAVFFLYWILPHKYRWPLLLAASYFFYMCWKPVYALLILATTLVSYTAAILIEKAGTKARKRLVLAAGAAVSLGVLFLYKYFNFASRALCDFIGLFTARPQPLTLKLLLPVGISFYTFQTLGYIIDVYRKDAKAERHFGIYATFVSFFPQLVAGPIERSANLIPQIREERKFDSELASYGLKQLLWGFFKKVVIADRIALYAARVFENPEGFKGFSLLAAVFLFTVQIYCDFSGYSDMAIGTAKLLGIKLTTNFKSPYFAGSLRDFWGRWHISLSTWFKDYVYIPLGGNRKGKPRQLLNLFVTFLLSGLWHGADWTFLVWGGAHGAGRVFEEIVFPKKREFQNKVLKVLRGVLVFLFCSFLWIFFASKSIGDSFYVIGHMFEGISAPLGYIKSGLGALGFDLRSLAVLALATVILILFDAFSVKRDVIGGIAKAKPGVRWAVYILFTVFVILCIPAAHGTEFIYFSF